MDQSSKKENLDPLPDSSNKEFWVEAEVHTGLIPKKVPFFDEPHFFVRKSGNSAQCNHCDWGFDLDPGDKIEEGHLYSANGKRVL